MHLGIALNVVPGGHPPGLLPQYSAEPAARVFGDYELLELIARGGMGIVYRARQKSLNRIVALKMLPVGLFEQPEFVERFRSEAEAIARLQHPNIVSVHEIGEHQGQPYFSMDYIAGRTLADTVREGPLQAELAATYLKTIAEGIHHAHQRGILHRDLKPSNILIDQLGQPRITDFGLAKHLFDSQDPTHRSPLTVTGQVLGSPNYLSPEQASGRHSGAQADVYSLGAVLYHLLTGRPPFQADSLTALLREVVETDPVAPRLLNPSIPRDIETVCLKALEKQTTRRYESAHALADELGRFLDGKPVHARPVGLPGKAWRLCRRQPVRAALAGVVLLTLLLGSAAVLWQWRRAEGETLVAQQHAYAADMKEAQRALQENDLRHARELLTRHWPGRDSDVPMLKSRADLRGWEWRYLWARCQGEERFTLCRYSNAVTALAFSGDGRWLAVRRDNGTIVLRDAFEKDWSCELAGEGSYKALALSPTDPCLAWANREPQGQAQLSLWDFKAQRHSRFPLTAELISVAFSAEGHFLAALAEDGAVRVWDIQSEKLLHAFMTASVDSHRGRLSAAAQVSPNRFTSSPALTDHFGCVVFSPDGRLLAIGESRPRIWLLDLQSGETNLLTVAAPADGITALAFSPDGRLLAGGCGAYDHEIRIWDLAGPAPKTEPPSLPPAPVRLAGHTGWVSALAFSPDGRTLASASSDQTVRLWDMDRDSKTHLAEERRFQGHIDEVWALAWSPDGKDLLSGARDGSVRYWNPFSRARDPFLILSNAIHFWTPSFLPDSRSFLAVTKPEGQVWRWNTDGRVAERLSWAGSNHTCIGLSGDGRLMALGDVQGNVRVWDFAAHQVVTNLVFRGGQVFALFFSPCDTYLHCAAFGSDTLITGTCWTVANWRDLREVKQKINTRGMFDGGLSPDERIFAFTYSNGTAVWWDISTQETLREPLDCRCPMAFMAFSPDGRQFATAGLDGTMLLWDVARTGRPRPLGRGHRNALHDIAFSPDSRRLVASGTNPDGPIKIWDPETGRDLACLPGIPGWYIHIGFSPDGNILFASSTEGHTLLWHAPALDEIEQLETVSAGRRR